jgi:hypothetical protein
MSNRDGEESPYSLHHNNHFYLRPAFDSNENVSFACLLQAGRLRFSG